MIAAAVPAFKYSSIFRPPWVVGLLTCVAVPTVLASSAVTLLVVLTFALDLGAVRTYLGLLIVLGLLSESS